MTGNTAAIIHSLHEILRGDELTNEIAKTVGTQLEKIHIAIQDILIQNFIDTATWGIEIHEKELEIPHIKNKPLEERRAVIRAKLRGSGSLTLALIKQTIDAFTDRYVDVTFVGIIKIDFSSSLGRPLNIADICEAIETIKPAHIGTEYVFRFRTWKELKRYRYRYLLPYSWVEVKEKQIETFTEYQQIKEYLYQEVKNNTWEYVRKELYKK